MTEKKQKDIDFDNELSSLDNLDDLLKANDSDIDGFPLDDEIDGEFAEPLPKKSAAKPVMVLLLLTLLGGGVYAGMTYFPSLMVSEDMSEFEQAMQARSDSFEQSFVAPQEAMPTPEMPNNNIGPVVDNMNANSQLPTPADTFVGADNVDDNAGDIGISDIDVTIVQEGEALPADIQAVIDGTPDVVMGVEETATTATNIAEMVEIAETAGSPDVNDSVSSSFDVVEDAMTAPTEGVSATMATIENNIDPVVDVQEITVETPQAEQMPPMFERVQAQPLKRDISPAVEEATIIETDMVVAETPTPTVMEPVIDPMPTSTSPVVTENTPEAPIMPEMIAEPAEVSTPGIVAEEAPVMPAATMPNLAQPAPQPEVDTIPTPPPSDAMAIQTPETVAVVEQVAPVEAEVSVVKAEPVKSSAAPAPKKTVEAPADPRVNQARLAYDAGDYQTALDLYQAVLNKDAANTAALTGHQLAKAKLRATASVSSTAPATTATTASNGIQSLIAVANANPRDAKAAADVADAYRDAGQKVEALNWYRKALQLDAIYSGKIDRNAVYDAMATVK